MTRTAAEALSIQRQALDLMRTWDRADRLFQAICEAVCERHKQEALHGVAAVGAGATLAEAVEVLREEFEEVVDAATRYLGAPLAAAGGASDRAPAPVRELLQYECVQVAAVALAMVERLQVGDWTATP